MAFVAETKREHSTAVNHFSRAILPYVSREHLRQESGVFRLAFPNGQNSQPSLGKTRFDLNVALSIAGKLRFPIRAIVARHCTSWTGVLMPEATVYLYRPALGLIGEVRRARK